MALTATQKDIIKSSIDYLLDFSSSDEDLLKQKQYLKTRILELKYAIKHEIGDTDPFYHLCDCLFKPTKISNLENYNDEKSPATIGDVQNHMIDYITENIKATAEKINLTLEDLKWESSQIKKLVISSKHSNKKFKSVKPATESVLPPWQMIYEKGDIYYAALQDDDNIVSVNLSITINIPNAEAILITIDQFKIRPEYEENDISENTSEEEDANDEDTSQFLLKIIPEAKLKAYEIARAEVLNYLITKNFIDEDIKNKLDSKPFLDKIILHDFYLANLINLNIPWSDILDLTEEEVESFVDPTTIQLFQDKLCSTQQAKFFKTSERKVIAVYYSAIFNDSIPLSEMIGITDEQQKLLVQPIVKNLITEGKLTFTIAKSLPTYLVKLFTNTLYMDFLQREDIEWVKLRTLEPFHCSLLQTPGVSKLVIEKIISLTTVSTLPEELFFTLQRENINELLLKKVFSPNDLENISLKTIQIMDDDPSLCKWMMNEIICLDDIHPKDLPRTYSKAYAKRLLAIMMNTPYFIDKFDNAINEIDAELFVTASSKNMTLADLLKRTIERFIHDLASINKSGTLFFSKFVEVITLAKKNKLAWDQTLSALIETAENTLQDLEKNKAKKGFSVFENTEVTFNLLKKFCLNMKNFSTFLLPQSDLKDNISMEIDKPQAKRVRF